MTRKINPEKREELLEQYGKVRKSKEKALTYAEMQAYSLEMHAPIMVKGIQFCNRCKETIDGVEALQKYPCISLQRVGLGNG